MPGSRRLLALATVLLTVVLVAACTSHPEEPSEEMSSVASLAPQPEAALTMTAWPTPPPVITQPPTATTAPQPLWTAEPEPTVTSSREPASTSATAKATPTTGPSESSKINPAPLGSLHRPIRLLIPDLALDVPVVEVGWDIVLNDGTWHSVWQTANGAAGHHRNSANPGEAGNVILSGHHNTRGEVFRMVSEIGLADSALGEGSEITIMAEDGRKYAYSVVYWDRFEVEGAEIAERQRAAAYLQPSSEPLLTLITCWPYESNSHRVVVVAELQAPE
jgi:LPXTG-site transpeptidase (sortase) family protein